MIQLDHYVIYDNFHGFNDELNKKLIKMQKDGCKIIAINIPTNVAQGTLNKAIHVAYITYDKVNNEMV